MFLGNISVILLQKLTKNYQNAYENKANQITFKNKEKKLGPPGLEPPTLSLERAVNSKSCKKIFVMVISYINCALTVSFLQTNCHKYPKSLT